MLGVTLDRSHSDKLCLIAHEGETLGPAKTALKVTHGWFQSDYRPALSAFEAWTNAGATHHGSLSPGKLAEATRWLGMTCALPVHTITQSGIQHD